MVTIFTLVIKGKQFRFGKQNAKKILYLSTFELNIFLINYEDIRLRSIFQRFRSTVSHFDFIV